MILDLDTLFPEGLSDQTVAAVAELLNELANQRIRHYQASQQLDLFDADKPWRQTGSG